MGGLEIEVVRADGRPAVGARVRVPVAGEHRTDETGVLRIEQVLAGDHEVVLDEAGLVSVAEQVAVVAGEVTRVVLQEPVGATLVVTVKGADGTPLPHAMVTVGQASGSPWADLAPDGLQRLDPYTDERGRRALRRVESGRIRLGRPVGGLAGHARRDRRRPADQGRHPPAALSITTALAVRGREGIDCVGSRPRGTPRAWKSSSSSWSS